MKKKLLITGHRGFIGSALVSALGRDGEFEVIGVSRSEGKDLSNPDALNEVERTVKIIHLAGSVGVLRGWTNPYETYRNNLLSALSILEFSHLHKTPLIYMSSYIYGIPQYLPIDENHPVQCNNPYANSKRQGELLCEAYARNFGVPITILRPFNIYGPGETQEDLISSVIRQAKKGGFIEVRDLRPKRDYLYMDDLVEAVMKVVHSEQKGLEIYNLGSGKSCSVEEVIETVFKLIHQKLPVRSSGEYRSNEIMDCYSDSRKFSQRFGWKPKVSLEEGIQKLLHSFPQSELVEGRHEES